MKVIASDRRDRLRAMLADLKMPGALEAVDGVLAQVDSGAVTAGEAIEQCSTPRSRCATTVVCKPPCVPRACRPSRRWASLTSPSSRASSASRLRACTNSDSSTVARTSSCSVRPAWGKTHLAISLAIAAAEAGRRVYYGTLARLVDSLMEARAAGELFRRLRVLTHPALLVVDEIGYLPVSQDGAVLFFQLINARHERASTVLTSNKGFEEWGNVLGDEIMAAALIDRLLHHCHIVNIRGNSYRMREHQHWLQSASEDRREGVVK